MNQIIHLIVIFISLYGIVFGQSSTSCSNSNLLMTPTLRQQVLDYLNDFRDTTENGQYLFWNGKYALPAESLPDLTWDCEIEEDIHDWLVETCDKTVYLEELDNMTTWIHARQNDDNVNTLVSNMLAERGVLSGYNYIQLAEHNLYIYGTSHLMKYVQVLSDKAQKVGCAIHHCSTSGHSDPNGMTWPAATYNKLYCRVSLTENLEYGDEIYKVSPSANYIPPSQDLVCQNSMLSFKEKEAILQKVNEARSQISQEAYNLQNGGVAVKPAQPLLPLRWSCADESALTTEKSMDYECANPVFDAQTEFEKIVTGSMYVYQDADAMLSWWNQFGSDYFVSNPNLNFLSQSATYSEEYPAAFALSQNAETIACTRKTCYGASMSVTWHLICRVKPQVQIGAKLYQV